MKKYFLLLFIAVTCVFSASAQITAITSEGKKVILKDDKTWEYYVEKPREVIAGEKIVGDEVKPVIKLLPKLEEKLKKSQFETQEQFYQRMGLLFAETMVGDKSLEDVVIVSTPTGGYDAEKQEMYMFTNYSKLADGTNIKLARLGTYGYNELGYADYKTLRFKISPERGQAELPKMRLAVYGVPIGYKSFYTFGELYIMPVKFALFNPETNEVYAEMPFNEDDGSGVSSSSSTYNGPVQVKGYFRKDGTYVKSHTRSRPKP